jgi:hypothetical protein
MPGMATVRRLILFLSHGYMNLKQYQNPNFRACMDPQPLEIDLGPNGGLLSFQTGKDLKVWIDSETEAWKWMNLSSRNGVNFSNSIWREFSEFTTALTRVVNNWGGQSPQQTSSDFSEAFKPYLDNRTYCSKSAKAIFIFSLKQTNGNWTAFGAYIKMLGRLGNWNGNNGMPGAILFPEFVHGILEAILFERNIDFSGNANLEVFNKLKSDFEKSHLDYSKKIDALSTESKSLTDDYELTLKTRKESLENFQDKCSNEFKALLENQKVILSELEKVYDQKLALQKPVEYWGPKEKHHGFWSKVFGVFSFLSLFICVGGMALLVRWTFSELKPGDNPDHWQLGILLVGAFFSIWFVRIVIKIFYSHMHLATDASERKTMILTYLSLGREGSQFAPEDRTLIVQHIFRSAADGFVKDDSAPPSFLEFFSRH